VVNLNPANVVSSASPAVDATGFHFAQIDEETEQQGPYFMCPSGIGQNDVVGTWTGAASPAPRTDQAGGSAPGS
jgi:hypothetical protein